MPGHHLAAPLLALAIATACQLRSVLACPSECVCAAATQTVMCDSVSNAFNDYASSIPAWTNRILLVCRPQLSSSGRPLPMGSALSVFRPGVFRRFAELREVSVRSCPVAALPPELFGFLPQLQTVTLDNLLLDTLPPGLFRGSPQLSDLVIIRCPDYRSQQPGLFEPPGPRLLRLVEVGLTGAALSSLLASSRPSLSILEVKMSSRPPLQLPQKAFADFNLTSLSLSNNGIEDFSFLPSSGSSIIALSYNPVPGGRLSLTGARSNPLVTSLHLMHMGLYEIPDGLDAFPNLRELFLASNDISELAPDRLANLSRLVRLDLSANQLQTLSDWRSLQPLLSAILYRDRVAGQIYLADNPLHCNCELAWIYDSPVLSNSLLKDVACRSGQFPGELLARLQKHQLRCWGPGKPLIRVWIGREPGLPQLGVDGELAAAGNESLGHRLSPGQNATLLCSASADPAPTLVWRALPSQQPPQQQPQELIRSRPSRDRQDLNVSLVLILGHGLVPPGRRTFECAAVSSHPFPETVANASLTVLPGGGEAATPSTPPPRPEPERVLNSSGGLWPNPATAVVVAVVAVAAAAAAGAIGNCSEL